MPDSPTPGAPVRDASRGRYRFREYRVTTILDPLALPTMEAVCVTGEERSCGATSGTLHTSDELTRWIAGHCAQSATNCMSRPSEPSSVSSPAHGSRVPLAPTPGQRQRDRTARSSDGSSDGNTHGFPRTTTDTSGTRNRR